MELLVAWIIKYGGVIALGMVLAERIARLTPNKTDDKVVDWVRKILRVIGLDLPNVDSVNAKAATESDK